MNTSRERFIKHRCTFLGRSEFLGRDRLDKPVIMNRYKFHDEDLGIILVWNTGTRPKLKRGETYLFSATPLQSNSMFWPDSDLPQKTVTRGKVYSASAES